MKIKCIKCLIDKPEKEMVKDIGKKVGYRKICYNCQNKRLKVYREKNRDRIKNNSYKYNIKSRYNLSMNEYENMKKSQNNLCKICNGKNKKTTRDRLCIDHCHKTGKIRGLICDSCNNGIARFNEDISILKNAIKYLIKK